MKIIFLDIDGVLSTTKSLLLPENSLLLKEIRNTSNINKKEIAMKILFDKSAIMLINRLVEYSGAKIVIISNWRRNIGSENTYNKLIEEGIKKEHFFEGDYYAPYKMTSEKNHDVCFWLEKHPEVTSYIVIDDDYNVGYNYEHPQVLTKFDEGLSIYEYRIALGYLGGKIDKDLDVYYLDNTIIKEIKKYEKLKYLNDSKLYELLYGRPEKRFNVLTNLATLLSYESAYMDSKMSDGFFIPKQSAISLFNSRKERALNILKNI